MRAGQCGQGRWRRVMLGLGAVLGAVLPWGATLAVEAGAGPAPAPAGARGAAASASAGMPTLGERVTRLQQAARKAREGKDYRTYRARLLELHELLNGHPEVVFGLARAEAWLGHSQAALVWLGRYAAMRLTHEPIGTEPAFAALRGSPAFAAVARAIEANRRPVSHAVVAFTLPEKDMVSEDLAYDPATRTFFVSSVRHRKILAVGPGGAVCERVRAGQDGIWSVLALAVDAPRRTLWASTAAMPQTVPPPPPAEAGRSALLRYDLGSGRLLHRYDLPAAGGPHVLGDMTLDRAGNAFVSEAVSGTVYRVRRDRDLLEPLVPPGTFLSPQTPAAAPDGARLFVADYALGIGIVDLASRRTTWLPHPGDLALSGIDGLYLAGSSLLAVQNGTEPNRVIRLQLDPALSRVLGWEVIESASPLLGDPTHGVVAGGAFYFLGRSGWDRLGEDGRVKPGAVFDAPVVLRVTLPAGRTSG
jgi:hypothetical protein